MSLFNPVSSETSVRFGSRITEDGKTNVLDRLNKDCNMSFLSSDSERIGYKLWNFVSLLAA